MVLSLKAEHMLTRMTSLLTTSTAAYFKATTMFVPVHPNLLARLADTEAEWRLSA